jgi:hypothetical protein
MQFTAMGSGFQRYDRWRHGNWLMTAIAIFSSAAVFFDPGQLAAQPMERWVYAPANFLVPAQVDRVEKLMRDAAALGYTHFLVSDSKFSRLHELDERYFKHIARINSVAKELNLKLVPAVFPVGYSNDLLSQNVNLAEGLPVKEARFEIHGGVATLKSDHELHLPDFQDRRSWNFIDPTLKAEGDALKAVDPDGENCRVMKTVAVKPFRHYHISVRVKTRDFKGKPQIAVLEPDTGRRLCHTNLNVDRTEDWTTQHITFNSLKNEKVNVYLGAWAPTTGSFWMSDAAIEECGLLNVLRRDGTPLTVVTEENTPRVLKEGEDFEAVADERLGVVPYSGEYEVWHESPSIRMKGQWADGTVLRVSWYHPHVIYDGQVCACVTEPDLVKLLQEQAENVEKIFPATDRMMSHDEWRVMGWDQSFALTGKTPGQVAADNVRNCTRLLQKLHRDRRIAVWNDMFDPHHNAVDNYYLVNGDLAKSWEGLDKSVIIMNWNFGFRTESLKFFAERGHSQILAGYYDADAEQIGKWLDTVEKNKIKGVLGVMYTTWHQDYSQLKEFKDVVDRFENR